jgi:hypothetical protein
MLFTFLPGSLPRGLTQVSHFYAWTSVTDAGEVVLWDYTPNAGWLEHSA